MSAIQRLAEMNPPDRKELQSRCEIQYQPLTESEQQAVRGSSYIIGFEVAERNRIKHDLEYAKRELEYYKQQSHIEIGFIEGYEDSIEMQHPDWLERMTNV